MASINPALCRAARGLLDWNQEYLAKTAKVGLNTIRNFEAGKSAPVANNLAAIQAALESAGIEFIAENGGGPGLRLRGGGAPHATPADHPEMRADGPEDEERAGDLDQS